MKKSKSKSGKKDCGKLKAKVRELRKEAKKALSAKEKATKKYKKRLDQLVKELEPLKVAAMDAKKDFNQAKKAYLKAKNKWEDCNNPQQKKDKKPKKEKAPKTKKDTKVKGQAQRVQPVKDLVEKSAPATPKGKVTQTKRVEYKIPTISGTEKKPPAKPADAPTNPARKTTTTRRRKTSGEDNLKRIEGIGVAIERVLKGANIKTFKQLAAAKQMDLVRILKEAGPRFGFHKPDTWPEQAALAANADWDQLKKLQEVLKGGRR